MELSTLSADGLVAPGGPRDFAWALVPGIIATPAARGAAINQKNETKKGSEG